MSADDPAKALWNQALRWLSRRDYSRSELQQKWQQKFQSGAAFALDEASFLDLCDQIVQRLLSYDYLNDQRYAEGLLRVRAAKGYGPTAIRYYLKQRGIPADHIDQILQESTIDWPQQLQQLWQHRWRKKIPQSLTERAKMIRFFEYRGYSSSIIREFIKGAWPAK